MTIKNTKLGNNLRNALLARGMTQQKLAENLGTTQQTISRWLQGVNEPDLSMLLKICDVLDETPNSLLGFEE